MHPAAIHAGDEGPGSSAGRLAEALTVPAVTIYTPSLPECTQSEGCS